MATDDYHGERQSPKPQRACFRVHGKWRTWATGFCDLDTAFHGWHSSARLEQNLGETLMDAVCLHHEKIAGPRNSAGARRV